MNFVPFEFGYDRMLVTTHEGLTLFSGFLPVTGFLPDLSLNSLFDAFLGLVPCSGVETLTGPRQGN